MSVTPGDVMREVGNFFPGGMIADTDWAIIGGRLSPDAFLEPNGWAALIGTSGSDGVYRLTNGIFEGLSDQRWHGAVVSVEPTAAFLDLCEQIDTWDAEHPTGGLASEQFGEYRATTACSPGGIPVGWRQVFAQALRPYRRMFTEVKG